MKTPMTIWHRIEARIYAVLTNHTVWNHQIQEMVKHLPPSQSGLRLLDVGCGPGNTIRELLIRRPDIRPTGLDKNPSMLYIAQHNQPEREWLRGNAQHLPFNDNSFDAVTAHSVLYLLENYEQFLTEALRVLRPGGRLILLNPARGIYPWHLVQWLQLDLRVAMSFGAWHVVGLKKRRFGVEEIASILEKAGYARILSEISLGDWAVLSRGEKPHAESATTLERVKLGATDQHVQSSQIGHGREILAIKARYLHLLVKQTPNKPVWALQPDEQIEWSAIELADRQTVLAFTSLSKAVEFMQAAVLAGMIADVNKMPKFSKQTASQWKFNILINPSLDDIDSRIDWRAIDPMTAEAPDE